MRCYIRRNVLLLVVVIVITLCLSGLALFSNTLFSNTMITIPSTGTVRVIGAGIYWDGGCSNTVSSIDWGSAEPGSTKDVTVYIRNEGNTAITLSLNTTNWDPPAASNYITLNWNYAGEMISPSQVIQITLTLEISPNISSFTSFNFDVIITGSQNKAEAWGTLREIINVSR